MTKQDKASRKTIKKIKKNDLPVLDSDQDLFSAFMDASLSTGSEEKGPEEKKKRSPKERSAPRLNKHGLPMIEAFEAQFLSASQDHLSESAANEPGHLSVPEEPGEPEELEENFALLLEASLKQKKGPVKKKPIPMPLKKRLKRYPPPEAELDLHGFTALGAELKAKAFISTCKHQGYFSLRLIVGKGLHSDSGPVLPDVIEDLLKILKSQHLVLAYEWDRQKKSKSGALIVYLKQFDD
jgi:DNA-nicking Smr family endonuclease